MSAVIAADLHLKISDSEDAYAEFSQFLETIKPACRDLYILGDLFAYWYEHPRIDFYSANPGLRALREFSSAGRNVYFIYGNRDFTAAEHFRKHTGVRYMGPSLRIVSGGRKIEMYHGDQFAKQDIRYQVWRTLIRSPFSLFIFRILPMGAAVSFADRIKRTGKKNPLASAAVAEMIVREAEKRLRKGPDAVIAGHAHLRSERSFVWKGRVKEVYIIPEFSFPGEFLTLDEGRFSYRKFG